MSVIRRSLFAISLLASGTVAHAHIFVPSDDLATGILQNLLARDLLKDRNKPRPATGSLSQLSSSTVLSGVGKAVMPAKLAATYPVDQQRTAEKAYTETLQGYRQIEARLGIPRNDVAGAVAAFIAGSWMAYRGVDLPDRHFQQLVVQMRQVIGTNAQFQNAAAAEKQEFYEQMAILGTTMALTREALKRQPDASTEGRLRETARGYLEQFLGTDADRVTITASGLRYD
jgi:hypothetical protein